MPVTSPARRLRPWRAFTLVELIVVILVLGILAAVAVIGYAQIAARAELTRVTADLVQLNTAAFTRATADNGGALTREVYLEVLTDAFGDGVQDGVRAGAVRYLGDSGDVPAVPGDLAVGFQAADGTISDTAGVRAVLLLAAPDGDVYQQTVTATATQVLSPVTKLQRQDATPGQVLTGGDVALPPLQAPPAPDGLQIAFSGAGATLSWSESGPMDVYRNGTWVAAVTDGTEFVDPAGRSGDEYVVTARTVGAPTDAPASWTSPAAPVPSTGAVTSSTEALTVSWSTQALPTGTTAVNIYRDGQLVGDGVALTGTWIDTDPQAQATYVVVPVTSTGEVAAVPATATSTPAPAPVTASSGPALTATTAGITLTWPAVTSTATAPVSGYHVYRQPAGTSAWLDGRIWTGTDTVLDDAPPGGVGTWCYRVSAYGPGGESALSSAACATILSVPVEAPGAVAAQPSSTNVAVTWEPVTGSATGGAAITSYRVTIAPAPLSGPATLTAAGSATSATFTGLAYDMTYTVSVAAVNQYGQGPSGSVTATTPVRVVASTTFTTNTNFVVPAGITSIAVAAGGRKGDGATGGRGAVVNGTIAVTPGQTLYLRVDVGGGLGGDTYGTGRGGGASDVRVGGTGWTNRVLVAAGGGAMGPTSGTSGGSYGGAGGALGGNGNNGGTNGGKGGTQTAGGAGYSSTTNGALGVGGAGYFYNADGDFRGGGGGGGYYGGGGGKNGVYGGGGGGGGGGSSWVATSVTKTSSTAGGSSSTTGYITLTY